MKLKEVTLTSKNPRQSRYYELVSMLLKTLPYKNPGRGIEVTVEGGEKYNPSGIRGHLYGRTHKSPEFEGKYVRLRERRLEGSKYLLWLEVEKR